MDQYGMKRLIKSSLTMRTNKIFAKGILVYVLSFYSYCHLYVVQMQCVLGIREYIQSVKFVVRYGGVTLFLKLNFHFSSIYIREWTKA